MSNVQKVWGRSVVVSVAVLPFGPAAVAGAPNILGIGLSEDIWAALADTRCLRLVSARPTAGDRTRTRDPVQVGRQLRVDYVLDGDLFAADDVVRVVARIRRVSSGRLTWTAAYEQSRHDVRLVLQDLVDVATYVLTGSTRAGYRARAAITATGNGTAHEWFLRGRYALLHALDPSRALAACDTAVINDPHHAPAHACSSLACTALCLRGDRPGADLARRADEAAQRAERLAPILPEAHLARGVHDAALQGDLENADKALCLASTLNPFLALPHAWLSIVHGARGKAHAARIAGALAGTLEPDDPTIHWLVGEGAYWMGDMPRSEECARRALELAPTMIAAHRLRALQIWRLHGPEEAAHALTRALAISGRAPTLLGTLGLIKATSGRVDEAETLLAELHDRERTEYTGPLARADVLFGLRRYDLAIDEMERAWQERSGLLLGLMSADYAVLRSQARFLGLLRRIGLPVA